MTMIGYDPGRLAGLRSRAQRAAEALGAVRSDDPAAAEAMAAVTVARRNLEDGVLGLIGRINASDPMGSWSAAGPAGLTGASSSWRTLTADSLGTVDSSAPLTSSAGPAAVGEDWTDQAERWTKFLDGVLDLAGVVVDCREGAMECVPALVELGYELVVGTVLTPFGAEVSKQLGVLIIIAVGAMMEQSPHIEPDWSGMGGAPGVPPYDHDGGNPEQHAPNGSNENGTLRYGLDCRGLDVAGREDERCQSDG